MSETTETCKVEKWDGWRSRACGRPVKRDGMCGIHAGAKERGERQRRAKEEALEQKRANSAVIVERLVRHGVSARVGFDGSVFLPGPARLADELDDHAASSEREGQR